MFKKYLSTSLFLLSSFFSFAQAILISEVDADTQGVDTKEFLELRTPEPFSSLNGHVVVIFNGSFSGANTVWYTFDLTGYETDVNGLFVIGGPELSPIPNAYMPVNTILNGNAAIGVYQGNSSNFPEGTLATTNNLVDALVYSVNNPPSQTLLDLMGETLHIDENVNGNKDFESMQRDENGNWFVATPTPRQINDGSGILLTGIEIVFTQSIINEGDVINIVFQSTEPVDEDLEVNFTLTNGPFTTSDFVGETNVTILEGETTATATIEILADGIPEDDELMIISMQPLPDEYMKLNNNLNVWVLDSDFFVSPIGEPTSPTFSFVQSSVPNGYYDDLNNKSGQDLKDALQDIIANEDIIRIHPYEDVWEMLNELDQHPKNSNQVWRLYLESPSPKFLRQVSSSGVGRWNREHVFPQSRGGFFQIEFDEFATGKNIWQISNADSLRHGMSDIHSLRVADATENNVRGNKHYGDYVGPTNNLGSFKGDVARSIFYMTVRYNGLEVVNGFPNETGLMGDLATLLDWHELDPPDDFELNRNNLAYEWQMNRNPFIDLPELADYIFGNKQNEIWNENLSTNEFETNPISVYPNPAKNKLFIQGIETPDAQITIYSMQGKVVQRERLLNNNHQIQLQLYSGMYVVKIDTQNKSAVQRIIIE